MIVMAALFLLAIYIVGRFISMPGYPGIMAVSRLYKHSYSPVNPAVNDNNSGVDNTSRGDWKLASMPTVSGIQKFCGI